MSKMLIQTDQYGRVTLKHYGSSEWDSMGGTVVEESDVPNAPDFWGARAELYYFAGSFSYKPMGRYPKEQSGDVDGLRGWMKNRAKNIRDEVANANVSYDGHEWPCDRKGRQSILEVLEGARSYEKKNLGPFSTTWITEGGVRQNTTTADLEAIVDKIRDQRQPAYNRYGEIITGLEGASTISQLNAIDVTAGW